LRDQINRKRLNTLKTKDSYDYILGFCKKLDGDKFIQYNDSFDSHKRIVIKTTEENLQLLENTAHGLWR
jgi:hypothetical protein